MSVNNQEELMQVLQAGEYNNILDTPESDWLDFKKKAYATLAPHPSRVLTDEAKYELCKDVSAFANNKGGVLLIGIDEKQSEITGQQSAIKVTPVSLSVIDQAHYKRMLENNIYPIVEDVKMCWFSVASGKGLLAIVVPPNTGRLHLLRHIYDENQNKLHGVGIAKRNDDQTYMYPAEAIYDLIYRKSETAKATTLQQPTLHRTLPYDAVKNISDRLHNIRQQNEKDAERIRRQLIETNDWGTSPVLVLQAIPLNRYETLPNFYDEVKTVFSNTHPIRSMGFNLNSMGRESDTIDGAFIKSGTREAALRLDPNGTLTLVMVASDNFLGWAINKGNTTDTVKINSIVLVEVFFEFVRFVHQQLHTFGLNDWEYCVEAKNLKKNNVYLYGGAPSSFNAFDITIAQNDSYLRVFDRLKDYPEDAFKTLANAYELFALPDKVIPYASDKKVTDELIKNIDISGR